MEPHRGPSRIAPPLVADRAHTLHQVGATRALVGCAALPLFALNTLSGPVPGCGPASGAYKNDVYRRASVADYRCACPVWSRRSAPHASRPWLRYVTSR